VNAHKSTADAAALLALSQLYRGVAALEIVDTTKLTGTGEMPAAAALERAKLAEAATRFASAAEALDRAIEVCAGRPASPDCDAGALEGLRAKVGRLATLSGGAMPALEDVQAAIGAAEALASSWRERAEALRGAAGHYPGKPAARP
jgi:hypothetical protein